MNPAYIILAVVLGVFFGAMLLLMGLFFWYLLKVMKELRDSVSQFARVIDPLIKTGALQQLSGASASLVDIGRNILKSMGAINVTVAAFNKAFFSKETIDEFSKVPAETAAEESAQPGESLSIHYDEEAAAGREVAADLRRGGVETQESRIMVPEQKHGSEV